MKNTHYIAMNEDSNPMFIVKKAAPTEKKLLERLLTGLSEEYDTNVKDVHYSHEKDGVLVYQFTYDDTTETMRLVPT